MGKDEVKMQDLIKEGSRSHKTEGENPSVKEKFYSDHHLLLAQRRVAGELLHPCGSLSSTAAAAQRGACLCARRRRVHAALGSLVPVAAAAALVRPFAPAATAMAAAAAAAAGVNHGLCGSH